MAEPIAPELLRVALFSGNYNYVKDGANQALNRLVGRVLARGGAVRVFSPVSDTPAFAPTGELVGVPSVPVPGGRGEYRIGLGLKGRARASLEAFGPNIVHLSAPDLLGHSAKRWGQGRGLPVVASVHTRFETYFDYYGVGFVRRGVEALLKRFYGDLVEIYAPSESMAELLVAEGYAQRVRLWSRGVDRHIFRAGARDMGWRRGLGLADDVPVVGFVGRLVLEKGLDVVADVAARLAEAGVAHRFLVVGDGPARGWLEERLPGAVFAGFLTGHDLGRAYASMDLFLNPSTTETFGNVTLEAMACGLPVVAAQATGAMSLVSDGENGLLVGPGDAAGFAAAVARIIGDAALRSGMGADGARRALAYDWDAINDVVIDRYRAILGAGGL